MTRTRLVATTLATATVLLLSGCGSDTSEASAPATSTTPAAPTPTAATPDPAASSAAPTPTPSATAGASAPAPGRLIDYEASDEDGIVITTAADTSRLTGAPADFKRFIAAQITQQADTEDENCTEPPQVYVSTLDTGGWARGGYFVPQCGGYAALWARSGGAWTTAWEGQSLVDCATLDRFGFPSRIAGDTCDTGSRAKPYAR